MSKHVSLIASNFTLRAYAPAVVDGLTVPACVRTIQANAIEFPVALVAIKAEAAKHDGGSYHITRTDPTR